MGRRPSRPPPGRCRSFARWAWSNHARDRARTCGRERANVYRRAKDRYARSASAGRVYAEGEWARIVAAKRAPAPSHVAKALGVDEGSTVGRRQRILGDGSGPTEISTSWFPIEIVEVART